jgi:hypothetical protein
VTALDVLTRVERCGGMLVVRDGRLVLTKARRCSPNLVADIRRHRRELLTAIAERTGVEQLALLPSPARSSPPSFLDAQQERFDAVCREFGIAVGRGSA